jgi:hypothetical protein
MLIQARGGYTRRRRRRRRGKRMRRRRRRRRKMGRRRRTKWRTRRTRRRRRRGRFNVGRVLVLNIPPATHFCPACGASGSKCLNIIPDAASVEAQFDHA